MLSEHPTILAGPASLPDTSGSSILTSDVQSVEYSSYSSSIPVNQQDQVQTSLITQHPTYQAALSPGQANESIYYDGASMPPQSSGEPSELPTSSQDGHDRSKLCDVCEKSFKRKWERDRHKKSVHLEGKPVKVCEICGHRLYRKDKVQIHLNACRYRT